jgi:DNA-binding MarR family transcriptional regulator
MSQEKPVDLDEVWARVAQTMQQVWLTAVEGLNLSPPLAGALNALQTPVPMRDLAQTFQCDASYITAIADRLEERGFAERRADPTDRRIKLLALTPTGHDVRKALQRLRAPGMERLTSREQATLATLLNKAFDTSENSSHQRASHRAELT